MYDLPRIITNSKKIDLKLEALLGKEILISELGREVYLITTTLRNYTDEFIFTNKGRFERVKIYNISPWKKN